MAVEMAVKTIAWLSGWKRDQDQLTAQIKPQINSLAGVQTDRGGAY
jgi:hypothetical protein